VRQRARETNRRQMIGEATKIADDLLGSAGKAKGTKVELRDVALHANGNGTLNGHAGLAKKKGSKKAKKKGKKLGAFADA